MAKFRKKAVYFEAEQYLPGQQRWYPTGVHRPDPDRPHDPEEAPKPYVVTAHGQRVYLTGWEWVVPEPNGNGYYPVTAEIMPTVADRVDDEPYRPGRELTGHKVNGCNEALKVEALGVPGVGEACSEYRVSGFRDAEHPLGIPAALDISFQNGPIPTAGVNGVTHEALLAILIDRLEGFQAGPYKCEENGLALTNLRDAADILKYRTEKRLARGVEGTHAA